MDMMEIRRRVLLGSMKKEEDLPDEYQRVEYIENTGAQYILTNYIPTVTEDMKIEMNYMPTLNGYTGDNFFFGAKNGTGNSDITFQCEIYGNVWYCGSGIWQFRGVLRQIGITKNNKYSFVINGDNVTIAGRTKAYTEKRLNDYAAPMCIFAGNWGGGIKHIHQGARIYKLTFTPNGTKEADFVPCYRKSDGEIGMYDIVSRTFYTNAGTGTFLKGADV